DKLGVEEQERRAQTKLRRLWLPTHMRACYSTAQPPLLHSNLTHPRISEAFYAYAYPLIHHPAQPSFYTKATLPTHMRALHAYACYHNTQHHHTPSCLTIFTLRPPFHAYASRSMHMHDTPLPTSPHSKLPTNYPRICVGHLTNHTSLYLTLPHHSTTTTFHPSPIISTNHPRICAVAYAYAWNTSHNDILHTPLFTHSHHFSKPTHAYAYHSTHMRGHHVLLSTFQPCFHAYACYSTHMRGNPLPITMPSRPHRACPRIDKFHA
ncbi:hypothetical protein PIB30_103534, partial [Stylosanthes scabra]|nr:hypothetical protein [Stylosanthes scabra]